MICRQKAKTHPLKHRSPSRDKHSSHDVADRHRSDRRFASPDSSKHRCGAISWSTSAYDAAHHVHANVLLKVPAARLQTGKTAHGGVNSAIALWQARICQIMIAQHPYASPCCGRDGCQHLSSMLCRCSSDVGIFNPTFAHHATHTTMDNQVLVSVQGQGGQRQCQGPDRQQEQAKGGFS